MIELSDIAIICEQYTSESGITVTMGAQKQIALLINCIQWDRHETWKPILQHDQTEESVKQWEEFLPEILQRVAEDHRLQAQITTIDVVYWTGRHLEKLWHILCPFPGPGETPELILASFPWALIRPAVSDEPIVSTKPMISEPVRYEREDA